MPTHVAASPSRWLSPRHYHGPTEPGQVPSKHGVPRAEPARDDVETFDRCERTRGEWLAEKPGEREALEVARGVDQAGAREQRHQPGRDSQCGPESERAEVSERGPGQQHVTERARMDDQAARRHVAVPLRGTDSAMRGRHRGARY